MDGFANPLLVEALGRTREGLVDITGKPSLPSPAVPAVGDATQVLRWEPWVRLSLLHDELFSGLQFRRLEGEVVALELCGGRLLAMKRPDSVVFVKQVKQVLSLATLREDRAPEILSQIDGQWAFWGAILPFRLAQVPKLVELMTLAIQFAVTIELRFKHEFACPRPWAYSTAIQPMITTPGHGTYPMGHATQVQVVAALLQRVMDEVLPPRKRTPRARAATMHRQPESFSTMFRKASDELALRIGENRIVAGVHFPADHAAGIFLGRRLGRYLIEGLDGRRLLPNSAESEPAYLPFRSKDDSDWYGYDDAVKRGVPADWAEPENCDCCLPKGPELLPVVWEQALREVRLALGLPAKKDPRGKS